MPLMKNSDTMFLIRCIVLTFILLRVLIPVTGNTFVAMSWKNEEHFYFMWIYIYFIHMNIQKLSVDLLVFQVVRFHGGALPAYVVANILLAYGGQLYSLFSAGKSGVLPSSLPPSVLHYCFFIFKVAREDTSISW